MVLDDIEMRDALRAEEACENGEQSFYCLDLRGMLGAVPVFPMSRTNVFVSGRLA
jgi:hypothetical protein